VSRATSRRLVVSLLSATALLVSCRRPRDERGIRADAPAVVRALPSSAKGAEASAPGVLAATATAFAPGTGVFPAARRACRVMALRGAATSTPRPSGSATTARGETSGPFDAGTPVPLVQGDLVPEAGLIELGVGAELTLQSTVSTREIALLGPALAEVCPFGEEAIRLSHGKVSAFPGGGVRPGAEVWVATPLGVVRFNDAKIDVTVPGRDADRIELALVTGHATFVPAVGVGTAGAQEVTLVQSAPFAARRPTGPLARWVQDLVGACVRQRAAAEGAGRLLSAPTSGSPSSRGDLAFAHVRARQRARAACETAWAAGALAPALLDASLRADLEGASGGGSP
jgi:hypothetical protein